MVKVSKTLRLVALVLLVPIVPFALLGWWFEPSIERFSQSLTTAESVTIAVVGLLAADIFLPVPSSVVATVAGQQLGVFTGTIASFVGMTLGSLIGFWLARRYGRPLAEKYSDTKSLSEMDRWQEKYSTWFLVFSRPLPVLAEAAVLLCGMNRVSWIRFLTPILICNLALSAAYAALGRFASEHSWFPAALAFAAATPLLLLELVRRRSRYDTADA